MNGSTTALYCIAVAAFCSSRGLTADEADEVSGILAPNFLPTSPGEAYRALEDAVNQVRDRRQRR